MNAALMGDSSNDSVNSAVDGVYAAFADARKPAEIDGCACCIKDIDVQKLLSTPLRRIEPEIVGPYASLVFLTVGEASDFFYLLPRILEILATDRYWWPDPEMVGRAIGTSGFAQWPDSRRSAVFRYFEVVYARSLDADADSSRIESWLCMFGRVGVDLRPFLRRLLAFPNHAADLFARLNADFTGGRPPGGYWEELPDAASVVSEWLRSEPVRQIVHSQWGFVP